MLSGLYSASSGLHAAELAQEVIARNLAHANVPGFRKAEITFGTFESVLDESVRPLDKRLGTSARPIQYNFEPGPLEQTGRPLDVALNGDGFFTIEGPDGPLYTRNGVFFVGSDGTLVNSDKLPVNGTGGPIVLPDNVSPGQIVIDPIGVVRVAGIEVGQLDIVSFEDNQKLQSAGSTLFRAPPEVAPQASDAEVIQGSRERANISIPHELIRMITLMRHYESSQRALRALDESIRQTTNPQG